MAQRWYQKASVQAALVAGCFLIVAAAITAVFQWRLSPPSANPPLGPAPTTGAPGANAETGIIHPEENAAPPELLPLSFDQLLHEILDESLTDLQRANLRRKYEGHLVRWRAVIHNVTLRWEGDPDTDLIAVVSPISQRSAFSRELITVAFDKSQREFLSDLVEDSTIEFEGTLHFTTASDKFSIDNAQLIGQELPQRGGT